MAETLHKLYSPAPRSKPCGCWRDAYWVATCPMAQEIEKEMLEALGSKDRRRAEELADLLAAHRR
jgi:hypothetical protein